MSPRRLGVAAVIAVLTLGALGIAAAQALTSPLPPLDVQPYAAGPAQPGAVQSDAVQPSAPPGEATSTSVPLVDPVWVTDIAAKAGIPVPAVRAYATAQLSEPDGCDVGWTTLAGIGWVESQHGTLGGRSLGADGRSDTPILGPALDGEGVAAIPATELSRAWHGDPVWDHAVGPLQFIPSTWEQWSRDGDGDGTADPNDIDDAAAAAAAYLCADGHDLTTGAGWADAVFGYNHDQSYVDSVHSAASAYASRVQ